MRVAMLVDWFFPYAAGVANAIVDAAEVFVIARDHGAELGLADGVGTAMRSLLDERVDLAIIRGRQRNPFSAVDVALTAARLRRFKPDVLHVQNHADWPLFALQRMFPRTPTLVTMHDVVVHPENPQTQPETSRGAMQYWHRLRRNIYLSTLSEADGYVVHGECLSDLLVAKPWYRGAPVNVIPHGIFPYGIVNVPPPDTPTILFFGRLEYYKGLDILIEAAECASEAVPDLKVVIAGSGADALRCHSLVTKPGLFDWRERYTPYTDLMTLFTDASVVVLPYREASQSGVVPLAFQFGRPVIATDVGALSEAVDDGRDGIVVPEVSAQAVSCAIVRVFSDGGLRARLTAGAVNAVTTGKLRPGRIGALHLEACGRVALSPKGSRQ
jgi:glycosyltransferase involved in cell wall biosynthesis